MHRYASSSAGVYAFSRIDARRPVEHLVASNNATTARTVTLQTFGERTPFSKLYPVSRERSRADAEGRLTITVPPLSTVVWRADRALEADEDVPEPTFRGPVAAGTVGGRAEVGVDVPGGDLNQVTFAVRAAGASDWTLLGTDDNAPYWVFHDVRDLPRGTLLEYRAVVRDHDGDLGVATATASVGDVAPPSTGGPGGPVGPVTQPATVTVPGSHGAEMGCASVLTGAGGDWEPACPQARLTLDPTDQVWKGTFTLPAGQYEFKAAINGTWDVNYGSGGAQNGSNVVYTSTGGPVTFLYDHRTNWVTNSAIGPVVTATGTFQSEVGCAADSQPDCLVSWLQDPDGDGTSSLALTGVPAGSYTVRAAQGGVEYGEGGAPGGAAVAFTVPAEGLVTTFRYVLATHVLTVTTAKAGSSPDLGTSRASWVGRDLIAWDVPDDRAGALSYRLHVGPKGSLAVDAESLGGTSHPLTLDPAGLPAAVVAHRPGLAGADALRLLARDAQGAARLARSGQLAVAAYDASGRLVDATTLTVLPWGR